MFQSNSYFTSPENRDAIAKVLDQIEHPNQLVLPGLERQASEPTIEVSRRELEEWRDDLLHAQQLDDLDLIIDAISDKIDR